MEDYLVRATAAGETVRAFAVRSTGIAAKARELHHTYPVVTAALGRLLSAGAMMGSMMKGDNDKLTIQMTGDGPIGQMTVTVDSHGNVKGFPEHPDVDIPLKYVMNSDRRSRRGSCFRQAQCRSGGRQGHTDCKYGPRT